MKTKKPTLKRAIQISGLSPAQVKEIQQAAHRVWDYIGDDCLQAYAEQEGTCPSLPRADVVELVLDADRLEMHGWSERANGRTKRDPAITAFIKNHPYTIERADALEVIVTAGFPFAKYGM
jgi:hypothetical protein